MKIFVTGASGYIGGSLATRLSEMGHDVRGLVRSEQKAEILAKHGMTPVVGELDDRERLVSEAAWADAVINAASTLHQGAARAIVDGARRGHTRILHTSGIGLVSEDVEGLSPPARVQDDEGPIIPGPHPMQAMLRAVEEVFLAAAMAGKHSAVISNAMIYGSGLGPARDSTQVPLMVRAATEHGFVSIVGTGVNRWSAIHIEDVVDLYIRALGSGAAGGFYFAEAGDVSFREIGEAIARRLNFSAKLQPLADASTIYGDMPARYLLGTNSVVKGSRARRELDWSPSRPSILDWIGSEMALPLRSDGG